MSPSQALYSVAQVRAFDAHATRVLGVPGYTLMQRAAEAALHALRSRWPTALRIAIVCGGGNNGGDGYVLGRYARAAGLEVSLYAALDPAKLQGDAKRAADDFRASGGVPQPFSAAALAGAEVLVDALLGTGARAPLPPELLAVIGAMNQAGVPILALDLPSGLDADRGVPLGDAVRADATITFVAPKCGLYIGAGPEHAGRVSCDTLGVTPPDDASSRPVLERIDEGELSRALPRRSRTAHKGDFGRVLLIAGGPGMAGAARLAGEACLRSGAGLVTVASAPENVTAIVGGRPELICFGARTPSDIEAALASATVVAAGPGLGTSAWARALLDAVLACGKPLVIDADGLNLLAASGTRPPPHAVLTPHPGEAARLLGWTTVAVQADRPAALQALVEKTGAVVVLKGAGTLVGAPGRIGALCTRGNPGMAAPGMGDVLTGAIAALLAQCGDALQAARAGVIAHALAGDDLARQGGGRGMLALEVAEGLTRWVNP
ncbi:MAG TPA: NAD(P)H-hydrate dehydratase [Steroidobacteraceae bacterium]|nr:NAD(P)H-hydrate dehydratase [Steroidobacteraceae bacterium]